MLRTHLISVLFLLSLVMSSSCVSKSKYYPVTDRAPRQNSYGFSISPPQGSNWYEKHKGDSLLYLKKTKEKDHLVYMKATEITINPALYQNTGFKEYVRTLKRSQLPGDRYKNIAFQIYSQATLSPRCERYRYTYEDHGDALPENSPHVKVENSGLVCMHPNKPDQGIDMYYIERAGIGADIVSYKQEGDQFLDSLKFDPVN